MDKEIINKTFRVAGVAGILLLITNILMLVILPRSSGTLLEGFHHPLIAFEFVQSEAETESLFFEKGTEDRGKMINAIDTANKFDFFFMACYTAFLILYSTALFLQTRNKIFYAGIFLALLIVAGDIMENIQMFGITGKLGEGTYGQELWRLQQFTWMKWGTLSVEMFLLSWLQYKKEIFNFILVIFSSAAAIAGMAAFIHRSILNEIYLVLLSICFLLMVTSCFFKKKELEAIPE